MRSGWGKVWVVAALIAATTPSVFAQQSGSLGQAYTITDLGVPFTLNDTDSHATAINNNGTVVGYSGDYSNSLQFPGFLNQDAFIWVPDSKNGTTGAMTFLGGLPGDFCFTPAHTVGGLTTPASSATFPTVAASINNAGQVVGQSYTSSDGLCTDAVIHAALWQNGGVVDLGAPGGYIWSYGTGINSNGQITGWTQGGNFSTTADAFFYVSNAFSVLGSLFGLGHGFAVPNAINDSGTIVGTDINNGFVHRGAGPILPSDAIGTLGGSASSALGINNAGHIVGTSQIGGDFVATHAYYADPAGMHDLGTESTNPLANSQAQAINNNSNDIVGWSNVDPVHMWLSDQHAVIWKDSGALIDLNGLLDPSVVPPYGTQGACPHIQCWELVTATGINDLGQIVGEGIVVPEGQTTGQHHAFLLTPICTTQGGDSDGDGLCDNWEKFGYTAPDGAFVDLPAMGADPNHKDIFVQTDYLDSGGFCEGTVCFLGHTHKPNPDAMAQITAAFANAPVDNPDGTNGITLHVDSGPDSIMNPLTGETWGSFSQAHDIPETLENIVLGNSPSCPPVPPAGQVLCAYDFSDFNAIASANMAASRLPAFHYVLFGHSLGDLAILSDGSVTTLNTTGITPFLPGSASIVSLGNYFQQTGTSLQQAGTLMHELGHQLGLLHGGQDDTNYKPNFLSVMNYSFQMDGLLANGASSLLDYSEFSSIPPLNEDALDDAVGLNGGPAIAGYGTVYYCPSKMPAIELDANGPIDWACDGSSAETNVGADIAQTGNLFTILNDYEDWHHLIYQGGTIGAFGASSPFVQPSTPPEPEGAVPPIPVPFRVQIASPGVGTIPQGANVSLKFTVNNTGTQADAYSISATTSDSEWNISNIPSTIILAAGASQQISVPLAISGCISTGATLQLKLRAISQNHPVIYDSAFAQLAVQGTIGGIAVPSLAGVPQSIAQTAITDAGFSLGSITMQASSTIPAGDVISQTPASCSLAATGTAISIVVSSGPPETIVPNVVGQTQAAAIAAMNAAGLNLGSSPITVSSATVPAGDVVSQSPTAGANVTPGTFFTLTVSSLTPQYDLTPNVVGDPVSSAILAITSVGLNLGSVNNSFSSSVPAGQVISQVPASGTPVAPGSYVNLNVSYGSSQSDVIPNVVGDTQTAATGAILSAGLSIGPIGEESSTTVPAGVVISQSPAAGVTVLADTPVTLRISVGAQPFVVPNIYGLTQATATTAITAAGLSVGTVSQFPLTEAPVGAVFSQSPVAGTYATGGSAVNLQISSVATQYTVPDLVSNPTGLGTAYANIIAAGLTPGVFTSQMSSAVPQGEVISESPASGTTVAGGSVVNVNYSAGSRLLTVPNVVGENQTSASFNIISGGGFFVSVTRAPSSTVPDSFVISQSPGGGSQAQLNTTINLVVSSGSPSTTAAVPNVVGARFVNIAEQTLNSAGFAVGSVTYQPSPTIPLEEVISQSPPAGTIVAQDTAVSLVYSSGPASQITVPNIVGDTEAHAIVALNGVGLKWTLTTQTSQTVAAGTVISQLPVAGAVSQGVVPEQSANVPITFVVSAGPATVPTYSLLTAFGDAGGESAGDAQFLAPISAAIDPITRNILAGDESGRIQVFDKNGNFRSYFGGIGVQSVSSTVPLVSQPVTFYPNGNGNGLFGGNAVAAIAVDPITENVVAVDSDAQRVLMFNSSGEFLGTFGSPGQGPGQFGFNRPGYGPPGVAIDPATENILVTDTANNRVQIFNSAGVYQGQFGTYGGGNGQFGFGPTGIAIDPTTRNIVVEDRGNGRVEIFNSSGAYLAQFGAPTAANASYGPGLATLYGVAIDPTSHDIVVLGGIAVNGAEQPAVQIFDANGNYLSQFGGYGVTQTMGVAIDPVNHNIVLPGPLDNVQIFATPITPSPTTTTLTSSLNPGSSGQTVTFTATVNGAGPTGSVQFYYGSSPLGTPISLVSGAASFNTSTLPIGSDSITAAYGGDGNNAASSTLLNETVTGSGSTAALATSVNPVSLGRPVTFTATVTGSSPTGTVEFFNGGASLGVPVALSSGTAALTTSDLPAGPGSITAVYSGDANNAAATSAILIESVSQGTTTTSILTSNDQVIAGQPVTFTAIVSGQNPSGTIQFMNGSAALGNPTALSGSVATITISSLTAGTHSITAVYGGDSSNTGSTSTPLSEQILAAGSSVTVVTSSLNPANVGQTVTFTANVAGNKPTGAVQFMDGGTVLGDPVALTGGAGSASTSSLTGGVHSITAVYSGDGSNSASTSAVLSQTIARVATFTVVSSSLNPAAATQTVTFTAAVAGSSPTGTIQFFDGTSTLGSPVVMTAGAAALSTSSLVSGTHSISAVYSGDGSNVTSTSRAINEVIANQTTQTITFNALPNVIYGAAPIVLSASVTSGLPVSLALTTGPATLSGNILTITGAGTVTVTATQAGNSTYAAATPVVQSFTVNQASLTVTANSASRPFGAANPAFTYAIAGFQYADTVSVVSGIAVETTTATTSSPAGSYPITFSTKALTAVNYTFTYVPGTLTIIGGTATLASIAVVPMSDQLPVGGGVQYTATGTYSDSTTKNLTGQATWASTNTVAGTISSSGFAYAAGVGSTTISASLSGVSGTATLSTFAPAYNLVCVPGSITTDVSGNYVVQLNVTNNGTLTLSSVTFTSAKLVSANAGSLPGDIVNLAPGSTASVILSFPVSAGGAGVRGVLQVQGGYVGFIPGGTNQPGGFNSSSRVTLP